MSQFTRVRSKPLEARVLPRQAGLYPGLKRHLWYRVRPGGPEEDGTCWLIGYGIKERVSIVDFEFRRVD